MAVQGEGRSLFSNCVAGRIAACDGQGNRLQEASAAPLARVRLARNSRFGHRVLTVTLSAYKSFLRLRPGSSGNPFETVTVRLRGKASRQHGRAPGAPGRGLATRRGNQRT